MKSNEPAFCVCNHDRASRPGRRPGANQHPAVVPGAKPATVEHIKIHGVALEGNLEGDTVDRDVIVFLPPSYEKDKKRRYPVIYALHGYSIGAEQWAHEIHVPLTDLEMPKLDGFALLAEIKRSASLCGDPRDRGQYPVRPGNPAARLELGAEALLSKPVEPWELARVVEPLLPGVNGMNGIETSGAEPRWINR